MVTKWLNPEAGATMRRAIEQADEREREANRVTQSLAAMAFALGLVVLGLFLVQHLASKARLEDCLLSGRMNCGPALVQAP